MYSTKLSLRVHPFFKDFFDVKPHFLYLKFERKLYHDLFQKGTCLETHLKAMRLKFKMLVTHLAMILNFSRPQYLHMEKGENRFKDEQLEALASIYGEDGSTYKDMQDVDYILKKIGYNDNPERAVQILELALKAVMISSDQDKHEANLTFEAVEKIFNMQAISNEIQQQKLAEIIENLHLRFQQNDIR